MERIWKYEISEKKMNVRKRMSNRWKKTESTLVDDMGRGKIKKGSEQEHWRTNGCITNMKQIQTSNRKK